MQLRCAVAEVTLSAAKAQPSSDGDECTRKRPTSRYVQPYIHTAVQRHHSSFRGEVSHKVLQLSLMRLLVLIVAEALLARLRASHAARAVERVFPRGTEEGCAAVFTAIFCAARTSRSYLDLVCLHNDFVLASLPYKNRSAPLLAEVGNHLVFLFTVAIRNCPTRIRVVNSLDKESIHAADTTVGCDVISCLRRPDMCSDLQVTRI